MESPLPDDLERNPPIPLLFRVSFADGEAEVASLHLTGELDCATAPDVISVLEAIETVGLTRIDIVADDIGFIDCSGLDVFREFAEHFAARGGQLRIVDPSPAVARVLALTDCRDLMSSS